MAAEFPVTLFADVDFNGGHKHIIETWKASLPDFNDVTSSIYIIEGEWEFYKDNDFKNPYTRNGVIIVLAPGKYPDVAQVGIDNDTISSLRRVR